MLDALEFRFVEVQFTIFVTHRVKLPELHHPLHACSTAVEPVSNVRDGEFGFPKGLRIGGPKPAAEQLSEVFLKEGRLLADFAAGQFRKKPDGRLTINNQFTDGNWSRRFRLWHLAPSIKRDPVCIRTVRLKLRRRVPNRVNLKSVI